MEGRENLLLKYIEIKPFSCYNTFRIEWENFFAGVVQLAERQLPKLKVAGSSPVSRSKRPPHFWGGRFIATQRFPLRRNQFKDLI